MPKRRSARTAIPATEPPAIATVFGVGLVVWPSEGWSEEGRALVAPVDVENECVGEGILERLGDGLAEGILDAVNSLLAELLNDVDIEEVLADVTEAELDANLGSCVLRPGETVVPTLAQMASTKL